MEYTAQELQGIMKFLRNLSIGKKEGVGTATVVDFATVDLSGLHDAIAADDTLIWLHLAMIANENTPKEIVVRLVDTLVDAYCAFITTGAKTLGTYYVSSIVYHLLRNPNAPAEALVKVIEHKEAIGSIEAEGLAVHKNFPVAKLPEITPYISSGYVMRQVLRRQDMTPEVAREIWNRSNKQRSVALAAASCQVTPQDVLAEIARRYRDPDIREELAENANTPPEILDKLVFDRVWGVRVAALRNPSTPVAALRRAYVHSERSKDKWDIQYCIASNPSCPDDILLALAMNSHPKGVSVAKTATRTINRKK